MTDPTRLESAPMPRVVEAPEPSGATTPEVDPLSPFINSSWKQLRQAMQEQMMAEMAEPRLPYDLPKFDPDFLKELKGVGTGAGGEKKPEPLVGYDKQPQAVQEKIDGLIKQLTSDDPQAVKQAQQELLKYGHAAAQRLVAQLDSDSFAEREAAQRQLARMGDKATPALYEALDKPVSLEQKVRAQRALNDIYQDSKETIFRDVNGNIRKVVDAKTRKTVLDATYNEKGELATAEIRGATFVRGKDGKFTRAEVDGTYSDVRITEEGGIRFKIDGSKGEIEWAPDMRTLFYDANGKLNSVVLPNGRTIYPNAPWRIPFEPSSPFGSWSPSASPYIDSSFPGGKQKPNP